MYEILGIKCEKPSEICKFYFLCDCRCTFRHHNVISIFGVRRCVF